MQVTGNRSKINFYGPYNDVQGTQINTNNYTFLPIVLNPRRTSIRSLECGCQGSVPVSLQPIFFD
jgi:hypothetical protein